MEAILQTHWPWAAVALVVAALGTVAKTWIWTGPERWRQWGRATMPAHPVLVAAAVGLLTGAPHPGEGYGAAVLYYAAAGACSAWVYDAVRRWFEVRASGPNGEAGSALTESVVLWATLALVAFLCWVGYCVATGMQP